jgi:hypothetical protein
MKITNPITATAMTQTATTSAVEPRVGITTASAMAESTRRRRSLSTRCHKQ